MLLCIIEVININMHSFNPVYLFVNLIHNFFAIFFCKHPVNNIVLSSEHSLPLSLTFCPICRVFVITRSNEGLERGDMSKLKRLLDAK